MNLFICGQRGFGRAALVALYERDHNIVGVAPPPQDKYYDKITGAAMKRGIPVISDCERLVSNYIPKDTDLIVAAHAHWYISEKVIASAKYGGIGFHPSLLPRHRGQDAVRWAVAMGDAITGATVYWLNDKVDGGDVLLQTPVFIGRGWDYHYLWKDIFPLGVAMLCEAVDLIAAGNAPHIPQNEQFATWEPSYETRRLPRNELLRLGRG
jgi:methionyl-tRNA formyltransferase